ncbi:hypothetical protein GCM10009737_34340 [Nocardioides lentus]|uniref:Type VII secretion protein EccB n=1 Tax=Nocardioides lentus TaxID=338077 RepID=A0ABN2PUJ9_9ACTN
MSTKKDLVEAHAFSRRRLVTAFVSGAPGGREVEPSRPGRTIVGGVALGVLVLAGGAIAGVFSSRPPDGWLDPGLVVAEGSLYAITTESDEPELRPVDPISGRLIFGADTEPSSVSEEDIAQQRLGEDIGILGAPSYLPTTDQLIDEGWTACTEEGQGIALSILETPPASPVDDGALVVTTGPNAGRWLVASGDVEGQAGVPQAFRYRLPRGDGQADAILSSLGLPAAQDDAAVVSEQWLNLWPAGPDVERQAFRTGDGPVEGSGDWFGTGEAAEAGDLVTADDGAYLVTTDGPYQLDPFEQAAYEAVADPGATTLDGDQLQTGLTSDVTPDGWPDEVPTAVEDDSLCAQLVPRVEDTPTVLVAGGLDEDVDLADLPEDEIATDVEPGGGAVVVSGAFGSAQGAPAYVVDAKGVRYQLDGADAIGNLGYGEHEARVVPDSWIGLLRCGVVLSRDAALRNPADESPDPSSC